MSDWDEFTGLIGAVTSYRSIRADSTPHRKMTAATIATSEALIDSCLDLAEGWYCGNVWRRAVGGCLA